MSTDAIRHSDLFISGWWAGYVPSMDVAIRAVQFSLLLQMVNSPLQLDAGWVRAPMEAIP